MSRTLIVARMTIIDLLRRRAVLGLLALMPFAFYMARRDTGGQAIRFATLGLAWAVSTAALFSGNAAKAVEHRLRLAGYRTVQLLAGRLAGVYAVGTVVTAVYLAVVLLDQAPPRTGGLVVQMLITLAASVPLGFLISALAPRDLEGMLLLMTVVGLQFLVDPAQRAARLLPLWSTRELGTYAVDPVDQGYLHRGLLHGIGFTLLMISAAALVSAVRLRRRRHLTVRS